MARFEAIPIAAALAKLAFSNSRLSITNELLTSSTIDKPPARNRETAAHRFYIKTVKIQH